jgi:hypothetical protein
MATESANLQCLTDLPCGLDRIEYLKLHPLLGPLAYLGLGWYLHAEFWAILVRRSDWKKLRYKLRNRWYYERNQPSGRTLGDFADKIDFGEDPFGHQLERGWFWHESDKRGFRWASDHAVCYLQSNDEVRYLKITGYNPVANHIRVSVDGIFVGEHHSRATDGFELKYLLPIIEPGPQLFEVEIRSSVTHRPGSGDERELGPMIFSVEVCR